jgi:hypothetical protein
MSNKQTNKGKPTFSCSGKRASDSRSDRHGVQLEHRRGEVAEITQLDKVAPRVVRGASRRGAPVEKLPGGLERHRDGRVRPVSNRGKRTKACRHGHVSRGVRLS